MFKDICKGFGFLNENRKSLLFLLFDLSGVANLLFENKISNIFHGR